MRHILVIFRYLVAFAYQEALCCLFPVLIFLTLAGTEVVHIPHLPRYDLILLLCFLYQFLLLFSKFETFDEMKVIFLFHVLGLCLELFKVHVGSWSYPEKAYTKFFGVPLYSGFMYASVASYMCQAWRRMKIKILNPPNSQLHGLLGLLIYLNFFSNHFVLDVRWILTFLLLLVCFKTRVSFVVLDRPFRMPLVLSYLLIGFFIWLAENIATFFGAWRYPGQEHHWQLVNASKISSWFLLCIISFIAVYWLKEKKKVSEIDHTS